MKKASIFLSVLFSFSLANAEVVNGVIAVVNNEPITNYELFKVMKQSGADKNSALEILIKQKLKTAQIKQLGIVVSPHEIDTRLKAIAAQNHMTFEQFQEAVKKDGMNQNDLENRVKKDIQEEKLMGVLYNDIAKSVTPENVRKFYDSHPELFMVYDSVDTTIVASKDRASLEKYRENPSSKPTNIKTIKTKLDAKEINSSLMYIFANTKEGVFSPIVTYKDGFEMFYVNSKNGGKLMDFEKVQDAAIDAYVQSERYKAVQEFDDRLRSNATIEFINK